MSPHDKADEDASPTSRGTDVGSHTCLSPVEILLAALQDATLDERPARHLRECADCRDRMAEVRRALSDVAASADDTATDRAGRAHLDEIALAELAEGTPPSEAHVNHLAACSHCRHELAALMNLLGDRDISSEQRAADARSLPGLERPRRSVIGGGLATLLAAAAVVFLFVRPNSDRFDAHRAPTITAAAAPALVFPVGVTQRATTFRWSSVPGTDRYRMTLFDASGRVLYESEVSDTMLAIPDSVAFVPRRSYLWKVQARTGPDRWAASELIEFSIDARRTP